MFSCNLLINNYIKYKTKLFAQKATDSTTVLHGSPAILFDTNRIKDTTPIIVLRNKEKKHTNNNTLQIDKDTQKLQ